MVDIPTLPTIPGLPSLSSNTAGLTSFLNTPFSQPTPNIPAGSVQPGYSSSMLSFLGGSTQKSQTINSNSILDFTQVENDPNFSRAAPANQQSLTSMVSKLGLSTQSNTAVGGLSAMSTVQEVIPPSMRSTLMNFMSLGGSASSKSLQSPSTITQGSNTWESSLSKDLSSLFGSGMSFSTIASMAAAVGAALIAAPAVLNTGASSVMPLTLQQTTPDDVTAIATSPDMQTTLADTSLSTDQQAAFTQYLTTQLATAAVTPVSSLVTPATYQNVPITMDDPLGLSLQSQLSVELQNSYNATLANIVVNSGLFTNQTDVQNVFNVLANDAMSNISSAFTGRIGLPSFNQVVNGVKIANKNFVIQAFTNAFNNFTTAIITQAGLNQPTNTNVAPVDYLVNIKKNLEARLLLQNTGATITQLNTYDSFLKTVIASGDVSPAALNQLNDELNTLLKETIEVC